MTYDGKTLDRRFELGLQLTSDYHRPDELTDLLLSGPGRTLSIPFPAGLGPRPAGSTWRQDPATPLPPADVVVITYTSDEAKALADVLTPGQHSVDWNHYTNGYNALSAQIRNGAPAKRAGRLGSYWWTEIGSKRVLVMKSELHMHQDFLVRDGHPTLPIADLYRQVIDQAKPSHVFVVGTAGGTLLDKPLGTVAASRSTTFDCQKNFKNEPFAGTTHSSEWDLPLTHRTATLELMSAFSGRLTIRKDDARLSPCPCLELRDGEDAPPTPMFLVDGQDGVPPGFPVITTDYFEFGTDQNGLDQRGIAVEMDDAVLGLVCSEMASPPKWASVRNYSDPAINGTLAPRDQETCAAHIYLRYGYWTSVMGAIGTWSIIAGL